MWEVGNSIIEVKGGGFAIVGFSNSPGISSGNTDVIILRIDESGKQIWLKAYGNKEFPNHEWGNDIIQIYDDSFIIVGSRDRYTNGSMNSLIIKVDSNGNQIWEKEFLSEDQISEVSYSISNSSTGSFYICNSINTLEKSDIFSPKVIKMDSFGNVEWQRTFSSDASEYHQYRATKTQLGNLIIVGSSQFKTSMGLKSDAFMMKIDSKGEIIWTKPYGTADHDDWGWAVYEKPDGRIIMTGSTKSFNSSLFDVLLIETNSSGDYNE